MEGRLSGTVTAAGRWLPSSGSVSDFDRRAHRGRGNAPLGADPPLLSYLNGRINWAIS